MRIRSRKNSNAVGAFRWPKCPRAYKNRDKRQGCDDVPGWNSGGSARGDCCSSQIKEHTCVRPLFEGLESRNENGKTTQDFPHAEQADEVKRKTQSCYAFYYLRHPQNVTYTTWDKYKCHDDSTYPVH